MRLLLDQCVYDSTRRLLLGLGHDVVTAAGLGVARAEDVELLRLARRDQRLLVTRDRDFGGLVMIESLATGVLYLRIRPATVEAVHQQLRRVLETHAEVDLRQSFVVVEPGRYRLRRLRGAPDG